ncbi:MAG: membrane protein [Leptospiraceae bacterium]|nr:MAG: membrane protein [Leptospiraceae bacterium]
MASLPDNTKLQFQMSSKLRNIALGLLIIGIILTILQIVFPWHSNHAAQEHGNPRLFFSLHLAFLVYLPITIGALFFVMLHHLSGAAWSVTIRRLAEAHVWFLPILLIALIIILGFGIGDVFHHWVHAPETDELIQHKSGWLNTKFFIVRNIIIFIVWMIFGWYLWKLSVKQDKEGKFEYTPKLAKISAGFAVVFAITISTTSWDLSMSVEPHWFSTIWAVYIFSGVLLSIFAVLAIWAFFLKKAGYYENTLTEDHIHDIGKYLWGSSIFWAYIGIASQFLLIWYGHIPEETTFFHTRLYNDDLSHNPWAIVSLLLVIIRFILPFFLLIKREYKRNFGWLAAVSGLILFGQIWDMYWILYPTLDHGHFVMFSWQEIGTLLLFTGLYILTVGYALTKSKLIPVNDPRLEECLHMHH